MPNRAQLHCKPMPARGYLMFPQVTSGMLCAHGMMGGPVVKKVMGWEQRLASKKYRILTPVGTSWGCGETLPRWGTLCPGQLSPVL